MDLSLLYGLNGMNNLYGFGGLYGLTGLYANSWGQADSLYPAASYAKFSEALQKAAGERQTYRQGESVIMSFPPRYGTGSSADESRNTEDMSLSEYKKYICNQISSLPVSGSCRTNCRGMLVIKEEAFVNMQKNPAYEKEVLDMLRKDFQGQYSSSSSGLGLRVIGGSAGECYTEGIPANSSTSALDSQKNWREERNRQKSGTAQTHWQLGRGGSLADRLAANRAGRQAARTTGRQEGSI